MNLNALRIKISDLKKDYNEKLRKLQTNATKTSIREINGHIENLNPPFDFDVEMTAAIQTGVEIARLSAILAKENNTVLIGIEDHTIQSAIATLQQQRDLLKTVSYVLSTREKTTRQDGYRGGAEPYYEVVTFNFEKGNLVDYRDVLQEQINALDVAITSANTNVEVNI